MRREVSAALLALLVIGCSPSEAPRVELPVVIDASGLAGATNELGWVIELEEARVVIRDLRLTTAGELDERRESTELELERVTRRLRWPLRPGQAWAHPGHHQDGEIIGELPGTYLIDFARDHGRELGLATMIVGDYSAANFGLARASEAELDAGDPLLGHTALLRGLAHHDRDGAEVAFTILIDSPPDREITGVPFEAEIRESSTFSLALRMLGVDPFEGDGLYAGLDFAALDAADGAADGVLVLADPEALDGAQPAALTDAYYAVRREFQTHDLFEIRPD